MDEWTEKLTGVMLFMIVATLCFLVESLPDVLSDRCLP